METLTSVTSIVERIKLEYVYDGMGRRVKKTRYNWSGGGWTEAGGRLYVYDGWLLVSELDPTGTVASAYTWGLDVSGTAQGAGGVGGLLFSHALDSTNAYFFICDGNGNITEMINAEDGVTSAIYEYGPFGDTIRQTGIAAADNPFRFSTKHYDEQVGLYYYGYRYYSPALGRWLNRDSIEERGGINLYGFVNNAPADNIDSDGQYIIVIPPVKGLPTGALTPRIGPEINVPGCAWIALWKNPISVASIGGNWRYKHWLANCYITRCCGEEIAKAWSEWKESSDLTKCWNYYILTGKQDHPNCYSAYQPSDFEDNAAGRKFGKTAESAKDCKKACDYLNRVPDGPPGPYYGPTI